MNRVTHFEIHADEPERALKFYTGIFGWEFAKWEASPTDYWLITTGKDPPVGETSENKGWPGINGGLLKRDGSIAGGDGYRAYVCTIDVANLDEMIEKVKAGGGIVDSEKAEIPGMGWLAYCFDTEGNRFGMMQAALQVTEPK